MIMQIGADSGQRVHKTDTARRQFIRRADTGELQDVRRADGSGGEDNFAHSFHLLQSAGVAIVDTVRVPGTVDGFEQKPMHVCAEPRSDRRLASAACG